MRAKVQLREFGEKVEEALKKLEGFEASIVKQKDGVDVFFENVDDARRYISRLRKGFKIKQKLSTEALGFKRRAEYLYTFSVRYEGCRDRIAGCRKNNSLP